MSGPNVLIQGCGDVGSAVAHRLFGLGACVVLCDRARPAHSRRGMAFTDAFFNEESRLENVLARLATSMEAIRAAWLAAEAVPVTCLLESDLLRAMSFDVVVNATMRRHEVPQDGRSLAPLSVGLGPGFTPGVNCHVAIETQWGAAMGEVLRDRSSAPPMGEPHALGGAGRERFVSAPLSGLWRTAASIGQAVQAGEVIGTIDLTPLRAALGGHLRGVAHNEVAVSAGEKLIEIDPRDPPRVFGLGERPRAIAQGVSRALGLE